MRTFKNLLWAILPIFALTFAVGCEDPNGIDDPINVTKDSTLTLGKDKIDASVGGGTYLIEYTIENAHQGEKISAVAAESWVSNFNYGITGALGFDVAANTGTQPRECLVTVKYRYADDAVFVVKQGARSDASFELANVTPEYFKYTVDVIPSNKTMPYIVMSADPEYILASGLETAEDFYNDDYAYFAWAGKFYGQSAAEWMQEIANIGDLRGQSVGKAASGVPYTFYCYYFDYETGALLSDVARFKITTLKPEKIDVTFTATHSVDTCVVTADVTPNGGYQGDYYFDMLNGLMVDDYLASFGDFLKNPGDYAEYWWATAVQEMMFLNQNALSASAILQEFSCAGTNPDGSPRSHFEFELLANHTYYLIAFAMDENALCCSVPYIEKIETKDVPMSDNQITPSVSKITAQTAYISFETTNDDYYIAGWEKSTDWATFGATDAERQEYLLKNRTYEYISGNYSQNVLGLEPGVEYVLYAFGSRGGKATTEEIWTCTFTTKSGVSASSVKFVDHGYFAAEDLAEAPGWEFLAGDYYSGSLILPVEFEFEGPWDSFFWSIYDWTGRYDYYNEKQYRDGLVWSINEYGSMSTEKTYTILNPDSHYIMASMVIDPEGVYSAIDQYDIKTSYDGARTDVDAFIKEWTKSNGPSISSASKAESRELFKMKGDRSMKYSERTIEKNGMRELHADDMIFVKK